MAASDIQLLTVEEMAARIAARLGNSIRKKKLGIVTLNADGTNPARTGYIPVQITGQPETYHAPFNSMVTPLEVLKTGVQVELQENDEGELEIVRLYTKQPIVQSANPFSAVMAAQQRSYRDASFYFLSGTLPTSRGGSNNADLSSSPDGDVLYDTTADQLIVRKHNLTATTNPATSDNAAAGYGVRSLWFNVTDARVWTYISESAGSALWVELTSAYPINLENGGTNADLSAAADGFVIKDGTALATIGFIVSTSAPTITDDETQGFGVFSLYHHYDPGGGGEDDLYVCLDASTGAARWEKYALQNKVAIFTSAIADNFTSTPAAGNTGSWEGSEFFLSRSDNTDFPEIGLIRGRSGSTDPDTGDILAMFSGKGYNSTTSRLAQLRAVATEDHNAGSNLQGTGWEIWTTPNGSSTAARRATIAHNGKAIFEADSGIAEQNLTPGATPSSFADGDQWFDTTRQAVGQHIGGLTHWHSGVIFVQTADGSAADTSSDEAMEGSGVGTLTIPANRLVAGSIIEAELWGRLNTDNSTASRALLLTLKYDGVDMVNQAIAFTNNYSTANEPTGRSWHARFMLTVRTGGASGTLMASVWMQIDGGTPRHTAGPAVSPVDFTASKALSFTGRWTSWVSGDTATLKALRVNQLI